MYTNGLRHFASSGFAKWLLAKDRERRRRDIINVKKEKWKHKERKAWRIKNKWEYKTSKYFARQKYKGKIEREEEQDENAEMKERKKKNKEI